MTVTGGVVAKLVGWSTHLFVSGRGFESFRYDGLLIIACVTELTSFGEICNGSRVNEVLPA